MSDLHYVFAAIVAVVSAARITRLVVFDHWPPIVWFRSKWDQLTNDGPWSILVHCGYCLGVWVGSAVVLWGYFTDFNTVWWVINGALAASYAAAIVVAYDGDE